MKYVKILGLLAVAAAALMVFAGSASAGNFTSPKNTVWTGKIHASAGVTELHAAFGTVKCNTSTVEGEVTSHGADPITGKGHISTLHFNECNKHVTVNKGGTLEAHTDSTDPSGGTFAILTSSGAEVTIVDTAFGVTCVFTTSNTEVGTVTNSTHLQKTHEHATATDPKAPATATTATIHVDTSKIPRTGGSIFCGSSGEWTGTYTVNTPDYLDYD